MSDAGSPAARWHDGRLLVPAVGAWLGAAGMGWWADAAPSIVDRHDRIALAGALVGATMAGTVVLAVVACRTRRLCVPWTQVTALAVAALALGGLACAVQVAAWTADPLGGWIDAGATAEVRGTVVGEALARRPAPGSWYPATQEVRLRTSALRARGLQVDAELPLTVRAPVGTRSPPPGSEVVVVGRLGAMPTRSGTSAGLSLSRSATWSVIGEPGVLDATAQAMRAGLRTALAGTPAAAGSLVAGLSIGDESDQPPDLGDAMRSAGLAHLTAVSGGNVAIVLGSVLAVAALARLPLLVRAATGLASLGFFVLLVGPQPSVLRASAMGAVAVVAVTVGGRRAGPAVLAAAVLVLVVVAPWLARSWAFALSAGATAGLIVLAPRILARLSTAPLCRRWPPALLQAVALTVAAQLATLPILLAMGGTAGWVAVPANLLAMPVVPVVTVLGLAAAVVSPVVPAGAAVIAQAAAWPAAWIAAVAHACASLPGAAVPWPTGWTGVAAMLLAAAVALVARAVHRRMPGDRAARVRFLAGLVVVAVAMVAVLPPDRRGWPPPGWVLIMCDVGQGDALLLRAGPGAAVIVDAGPEPDLLDGCLDDAAVDAVPLVLLTHFHADHVRGLAGAFRGRSVGEVRATAVREPPELRDEVLSVLAANGQPLLTSTAGQVLAVGSLTLRALWPRRRIASGSVPNNASVVLDVATGSHRLLLLGDVEPEAQIAVGPDLPAHRYDVVKVPHHGSRYQSPDLPRWAPAPIALVSVGRDNDYGHPAPETIEAWRAAGALVVRTDESGDVAIVESGSELGVVVRGGMLRSP